MKILGYVSLGIICLVMIASLAFGLEWAGIKWTGFFGPKREAVRREVFKQTRSYNEAKEQELLKYRLEYLRATDDADREALAGTIRMAFADYDESLLDNIELKIFLKQIKLGEQP
jgi:hypothetical protein